MPAATAVAVLFIRIIQNRHNMIIFILGLFVRIGQDLSGESGTTGAIRKTFA
jgi:hypothetical protein